MTAKIEKQLSKDLMSQTVWSNHPDGVAILKHKIENKEK